MEMHGKALHVACQLSSA